MTDLDSRRITPWVGRLLAVNAVVLLLQETLFTSEHLTGAAELQLRIRCRASVDLHHLHVRPRRPLHLAANSLALFIFGPTVERRLGGPTFIIYYLYCGIGAAIVSLMLHTLNLGHVPVAGAPDREGIVGASGALLGILYAFSRMAPDSQLMVFPIPVPIRARTMILMLAAFDVVGLFFLRDGIAHEAHLGGLLSGVLYFVLRGIARPADPMPLTSPRRRVPVTSGGGGRQPAITAATSRPPTQPSREPSNAPAKRPPKSTACSTRSACSASSR